MKKFIIAFFSFALLLAGVCIAQEQDSTLNAQNVLQQIGQVVQYVMGMNQLCAIIFIAAVPGVLTHAWVYTKKGIKTNPNTPAKMMWSYWLKRNPPVKLASILTAVYPSALFSKLLDKLPDGWITYVVLVVLGFLTGYFIDFVYSRYKKFFPPAKA